MRKQKYTHHTQMPQRLSLASDRRRAWALVLFSYLSHAANKFMTYHRDAHTHPSGHSPQCKTTGTSTMLNIVRSMIDVVVSLEQIGGSVLRVNASPGGGLRW